MNRQAARLGMLLVPAMALLFFCSQLTPVEEPAIPGGGAIDVFEATPVEADGFQFDPSNWWEVYFTDPLLLNDPDFIFGSVEEILLNYISQARTSIDIAAFEFDLTPVAFALIEAHRDGVAVRWVTDDEHGIEADEEADRGQFVLLEQAGIPIVDDGRSALMHNKFIVIDGRTVWTGSTNLTRNGIFRNNNNVIVIHDPRLAEIYTREFNEMWNGEFGPTSTSTIFLQQVGIADTQIQVLFGAEDEVMDWVVPLVESARSSVRFLAFSFTYDDLGAAMFDRAVAGVDVAGIFETRGSETEHSELTPLFCSGIPVRQDGNPGTMHHKVIVIDAEIVITGSLNFSENANDSNDENVLILSSPEIAARYLREFNQLWNQGRVPDLDCR